MTSPEIWQELEAAARQASTSTHPAHDFSHVLRVVRNALAIMAEEDDASVDGDVLRASALLHELFNYPKDHPESHRSGDVCAEHAARLLGRVGFVEEKIEHVADCIRDHAFSKGAMPKTLEGRILQDADRLDAIGAIGVARWAATCADMARPFYHPDDPFCGEREPNDKMWGVDHFYRKLLRIPETLHTATARRLAARRVAFLQSYLEELGRELSEQAPKSPQP